MRNVVRLVPFLGLTLGSFAADTAVSIPRWKSDLLAWRLQRETSLKARDGWLTLVGLHWLSLGDNTVGSADDSRVRLASPAPAHLGVLCMQQGKIRLAAPASGFPSHLLVDGRPAHETELSTSDEHPTLLTDEALTLVVLHRGDRYALRVKDARAPARLEFHGLHWYPPDPQYRVRARWIPWVPEHRERIATIIGTTLLMPAPGIAEFTQDGHTFRLEPVLENPVGKQLFFILRDTTSRRSSYGAGRFLYTDFPDHGLDQPGFLTLDFNRLQNPPCAYTPYATCPLPPTANVLNIGLPVGEARYTH